MCTWPSQWPIQTHGLCLINIYHCPTRPYPRPPLPLDANDILAGDLLWGLKKDCLLFYLYKGLKSNPFAQVYLPGVKINVDNSKLSHGWKLLTGITLPSSCCVCVARLLPCYQGSVLCVCACFGAGGYQVFRATHVRTHLTLSNQNWVYVQAIYFSVISF